LHRTQEKIEIHIDPTELAPLCYPTPGSYLDAILMNKYTK